MIFAVDSGNHSPSGEITSETQEKINSVSHLTQENKELFLQTLNKTIANINEV